MYFCEEFANLKFDISFIAFRVTFGLKTASITEKKMRTLVFKKIIFSSDLTIFVSNVLIV